MLEYEKSYLLYTSIKERLSFFEEKSNEVVPLMSILIAVLSYLIASLFFDKSSKKLVFYSMLYYTLILSLFTVYPFLREGNPYFTVSPMFVYLFTLIPAVLSDKIPDYYTQEGFSLLSGATASLSMILRSARRRRLRTGLTLFTVALVAFSVHTLNLMTTMYWSFEKELKYSVSVKPNTVLVVKPKYGDYPYSPLSIVFIRLLSEIGHTEALCIKRESSPTLKEIRLEYRGRETYVSGVISYTKGVTKFIPLESIVMKGRLPEEGLEVMISNNIANLLSINVDKNITIGKYTAKVVGIFRGKSLDDLRDLDGMSITPTVVIREGGAKTVERLSGDSIIICSDELASLLKIPRYKVYIKPKENPFFYAEKVAFISDSCTYVFYKNTVKYYTVAPVIIVKGESLVVPLIIAILTVFVSIMENVYERRKEIEILSSLGLNPSHIAYLFSLEGIVLGYVGSGIGLLSGFIAFKLLNMSSVVIPVDFKLSIYEILFTVFLAVGVSLLAALPPALKASTLVTPSLERRWKLKETKEFMEEGITERLPVRIPLGKSRDFVDFILGRFRELSFGLTQKVEVMSIEELGDREYRISFKYYRGSDISYQACFTENTLEVYKVSEDTYGVKVTSRPVTQHSKLGLYYVHETLSFLRKIALEWSSRALRIVVALGENPSTLYTVIKHLDPYEVIVVTEARNLKTVEYVKKALMEEKRRTPAIKTYLISSLKDIEKVLSELSYYIRESQYTVISYDSGLAGVLLSIASSAVRKKILLLTDKRSLREKIAYPLKEAEISEISPLEIDKMLEKIKTE
ncbi:MAG: hypothetical protein DRJ52_01305 [Thermoprotei archaeon]|nr:MAG: hypothetical protein DRJ52_01305 [Thermoprotei archaeon]